ncbi:MAG TPA: hypothetical protein VFU02_05465 [Polyangiaceae bacterium]|nr:hypothetical protein [Polyangiaceae bacterium]
MQEEIPAERARAFALAVLAESDLGCWALAVLTRKPHAARGLVELANVHLQREASGNTLVNPRRQTQRPRRH